MSFVGIRSMEWLQRKPALPTQTSTNYEQLTSTRAEHFSDTVAGVTAIVFLTVRPADPLFRFAEKLHRDGYHVYVTVDDNNHPLPTYDGSKVTVIKYGAGEPESHGYKGCVLWVPDRASSRCKSLYHFAHVMKHAYQSVWMIEEDVFVPSLNTIQHLDELYPHHQSDLLCTMNHLNTTGELDSWPHWKLVQGNHDLPWAKSMICAVRVSPRMLAAIDRYTSSHGKLLFDEALFNTLAIHDNLTITTPPELEHITYWERPFDVNEFKPFFMYHPIKSIEKQLHYKKEMGMEHFSTMIDDIVDEDALPTNPIRTIPLRVVQTYKDKSLIPAIVFQNMARYAPEYEHHTVDDTEGEAFLTKHFTPKVLRTFHELTGAHKADLLRYCLLFVHGGVYMDIKTELISPIKDIFKNDAYVYAALSHERNHVYQGIIATIPQHPLFVRLIRHIVEVGVPPDYHEFCRDFYHNIQDDVPSRTVQPGLNQGIRHSYYLLEEKCSRDAHACHDGLDRWGLCCHLHDNGQAVIKTRMASYPW